MDSNPTGQSLKDILRDTDPGKLDQPCRDEHLCQVARHITDWPYLAPFMGISRYEMEEIRGKWPLSVGRQKIELLRQWQEKHGWAATYRSLCKAFYKAEQLAVVEKICDILQSLGSSSGE